MKFKVLLVEFPSRLSPEDARTAEMALSSVSVDVHRWKDAWLAMTTIVDEDVLEAVSAAGLAGASLKELRGDLSHLGLTPELLKWAQGVLARPEWQ